MSPTGRLLVIGVGNRDRGDDAVGPIVCDLLASVEEVATIVFEGSVVDLPLHWSADDRVVVVDAAAPAGRPGNISETDALADGLRFPDALSTHGIDVGAAVELARALDRLPAELTILGVEGVSFEFGDELGPEVRRATTRVVELIAARIAGPAPA